MRQAATWLNSRAQKGLNMPEDKLWRPPIVFTTARISDMIVVYTPVEFTGEPGQASYNIVYILTGDGEYILPEPEGKQRARVIKEVSPGRWVGMPQDQIDFLRDLANHAGVDIPPELEKAQSLLHDTEDLPLLDVVLEKAQEKIQGLILRPQAERGINFSQTQSEKGSKPRARDGLTPEEREARNRQIIEHYNEAKRRLSRHGFATKYAAKYGISVTQIKNILSSSVDT